MILGETIPNGLNPKWSMIWGWFIVVFSTTDPELVESDPALVVAQKAMIFMDLRLFTF